MNVFTFTGNRRAPFGRAAWAFALIAIALSGCGGGGGPEATTSVAASAPTTTAAASCDRKAILSGTPTIGFTDPQSCLPGATIESAPEPCEAAEGSESCQVTFEVATKNVSGETINLVCGGNKTAALTANAAESVTLQLPVRAKGATPTACEVAGEKTGKLAEVKVTTQCKAPLILGREGRCVSNATPQYEYRLYVRQGVKLYLADTVSGVRIPVINGTSRTGVAACRWASRLTDGTQPFKCDGWRDGLQHEFQAYLDVASNTLHDLPVEKQLPATVWNSSSFDPIVPDSDAVAVTPDGVYFAKPYDPASVWFRDQNGNERMVLSGTYEQFGSVGYLLAIPVPSTKSGG